MTRNLVIILSELDTFKTSFNNLKKNIINELDADLCLCIEKSYNEDDNYNNPFHNLAKYEFLYNEENSNNIASEQDQTNSDGVLCKLQTPPEIMRKLPISGENLFKYVCEDIYKDVFKDIYENNYQDIFEDSFKNSFIDGFQHTFNNSIKNIFENSLKNAFTYTLKDEINNIINRTINNSSNPNFRNILKNNFKDSLQSILENTFENTFNNAFQNALKNSLQNISKYSTPILKKSNESNNIVFIQNSIYEKLENINTLYGKIKISKESTSFFKYIGEYENINNLNNSANILDNTDTADTANNTDTATSSDEIVIHTNNFPDISWRNQVYSIKKSTNDNFVYQENIITYKKPLHWKKLLNFGNNKYNISDSINLLSTQKYKLLFYMWFLLKNIIKNNLIDKYDKFIILDNKILYDEPHLPIEQFDENFIWLSQYVNNNNYLEGHIILSNKNIFTYLNILNDFFIRSNKYYIKIQNNIKNNIQEINEYTNNFYIDKIIKLYFEEHKILSSFKKFPQYYNKKKSINLIYLLPYKKNFGDELNIYIINRLLKVLKLDININFIDMAQNMKYNKSLKTFSFLGSIMHQLPDNIDVIGSGINPTHPNIKPNLNILALRGQLSKNFLNKNRNYKLENIVYGDPALLIPRLFPEWLTKMNNNNDSELIIGFIPHYNDIPHIEKNIDSFNSKNIKICYPNQDAIKVINFIQECNIIISSSLHGIIVSEMLQKDTKWLMYENSLKSETEFKYLDYYTSTNRINIKYAKNLTDALEMKILPPKYDDTDLFNLISNYLSI